MVFIKQVTNCTQDTLQRLKSASHENILAFNAAYLYKESIYLVYNYLPVTLKELERWYLSMVQIATVSNAIAQGLDYLHRAVHMAHGNLHTGTVVVSREGHIKIGAYRNPQERIC
jgi:serine/threonine protein kinase